MFIPLTLMNMIPDDCFLIWAWSTLARDRFCVPHSPLHNSTSLPEVTGVILGTEVRGLVQLSQTAYPRRDEEGAYAVLKPSVYVLLPSGPSPASWGSYH